MMNLNLPGVVGGGELVWGGGGGGAAGEVGWKSRWERHDSGDLGVEPTWGRRVMEDCGEKIMWWAACLNGFNCLIDLLCQCVQRGILKF